MVWHNDEPLDFANSVHIFALSRLAKQYVTVVLTGEGSDELFAGYPRYRIPQLARGAGATCPAPLRRLAAARLGRSPAREAGSVTLACPTRMRCSTTPSYLPPEMRVASWRRGWRRCRSTIGGSVSARRERLGPRSGRVACRCWTRRRSSCRILHRQDKMSMAAAIESRVPFMDYRIVEFANRLPTCTASCGGARARRS